MRRMIAAVLAMALATTGCASASGTRMVTTMQPSAGNTTAIGDYVQRLPPGSRVRVERVDGTSMRGTLLKAGPDSIVVQKNTRVPEPPVEVPIGQLARVTVAGSGTSTAKAVGIGITSGVAAFFAILGILAATWSD